MGYKKTMTSSRQVARSQQQLMQSRHDELPRNGHAVKDSCDLGKWWLERMAIVNIQGKCKGYSAIRLRNSCVRQNDKERDRAGC